MAQSNQMLENRIDDLLRRVENIEARLAGLESRARRSRME